MEIFDREIPSPFAYPPFFFGLNLLGRKRGVSNDPLLDQCGITPLQEVRKAVKHPVESHKLYNILDEYPYPGKLLMPSYAYTKRYSKGSFEYLVATKPSQNMRRIRET